MTFDYHILTIVAAFIVLDIASGFSQAVVNKTVDSSILRTGLWHKSAYVFAITLALLCEYASTQLDLGFTTPIAIPVCAYIALTEVVSIVENIGKLNPEILNSKLLDFFSLNRNRRKEDGSED